MLKTVAAIAALSFVLSACSSTGVKVATAAGQITSASPAQKKAALAAQVPANYRELIVQYARAELKDPYSIKSAEISAPTSVFTGLINGGDVPGVCVKMNAKNSFGAYIGQQPIVFAFKNGTIFYAQPPVFNGCQNEAYGPFPELEEIS